MSERPKPKSNAVLKNLPADRQEQIAEWCAKENERDSEGKALSKTGGLAFARDQLAADGLRVSLQTLSEFYRWWLLQRDLDQVFDIETAVQERTGDSKFARETAETLFLKLSVAQQSAETFTAATMAADMRRKLELEEVSARTKAQIAEAKLAQKDRDYQLALKKFQRDSCKLFLKWFDKEQAKKIATGTGSNAEKIEQLGLAMFGEDWNA